MTDFLPLSSAPVYILQQPSWRPGRTPYEVLEIAKVDILRRLEKYSFDRLPAIHALSTTAAEDIRKCIKSIFLQNPKTFIKNYASLDAERKISLAEEISFQIGNGRIYIESHSVFPSPRRFRTVDQPNSYGKIKILFEIEETTNFDEDAFYELVETVFRTAAGKVFENLSGAFSDMYIGRADRFIRGSELPSFCEMEIEISSLNQEAPVRNAERKIRKAQDRVIFDFNIENVLKCEDYKEDKEVVPSKEWKPLQQEVETPESRALKEFEDSIEKLKSSGVSPEEIEEILHQKAQALKQEKAKISLSLPKSGENYPRYPGRTNALEWLEKHWGKYLKYFNPDLDRDYLYQDQLGKLDSKLLQALKYQIAYKKKKGEFNEETTLSDFVPPKKERIDLEIADRFRIRENLRAEDGKEITRLGEAIRRRQNRQKKAIIFQKR